MTFLIRPTDSATFYDSTGDLEYLGNHYTSRVDRSFLDTFIDNNTFSDSTYDDRLRDSEYMLFTRLDSTHGGDMLFFNDSDDRWYKASISNTNLSSLTVLPSLVSRTSNMYRSAQCKFITPHLPYKDSDGGTLEYRGSEDITQSLEWSTVFQKENNFVSMNFSNHTALDLFSSNGDLTSSDSGWVIEITRYKPVTVGDDSDLYRHAFTFPVYLDRTGLPVGVDDSLRAIRDHFNSVVFDYLQDSYSLDVSDFDVKDSSQRASGSSLVRFIEERLPIKRMRFEDIRFIYPYMQAAERNDPYPFVDVANQSKIDSIMGRMFYRSFNDTTSIRGDLSDSGWDRGINDSYQQGMLYKFLDS
jgi:hypothetical protein